MQNNQKKCQKWAANLYNIHQNGVFLDFGQMGKLDVVYTKCAIAWFRVFREDYSSEELHDGISPGADP